VPVLPSWIVEPLWDQFRALLPNRPDTYPLGCHRDDALLAGTTGPPASHEHPPTAPPLSGAGYRPGGNGQADGIGEGGWG
jgi:hypothetical protein